MVNKAISNLTDTYDVVVTHQDLTARAQQKTGSAVHVSVDNFMNSPRYDEIVELVEQANGRRGCGRDRRRTSADGRATASAPACSTGSRSCSTPAAPARTPITQAGELLVAAGAVEASYVAAMHERETVGLDLHGQPARHPARHQRGQAGDQAHRRSRSCATPTGVDWKGKEVKFVIGIAGAGNDHLKLLGKIAEIFLDADQVARLEAATTPDEVLRVLGAVAAGLTSDPLTSGS